VPNSKQRREAARRHLQRQLASRQRRAARRRTAILASTVVGVLMVAAVVITAVVMLTDDDSKTATASGTANCAYTKSGTAARTVDLPAASEPATGTVTATVATNRGDLTFSLDRSKAPCTVGNFVSLATQKYYDDTPCHRLTTSGIFVLQCGDPTGKGTGGPGYTIPDEYTGSEKYTQGVLAMANTGAADTGGSQFFIVYKDSTSLPADYTIFGTVTKGLDVVQKVAAAGSDNSNAAGDGAPKEAVTIKSVTLAG